MDHGCKKDFSDSGCIDQLLCCLHHRLGVIQVAGVHQLMCLLRYRSRQRLVVMAKTVDTDAGGQINVFLSVRIPQRRAFSVIQRNRETSVCVHNISFFALFDFFKCHKNPPCIFQTLFTRTWFLHRHRSKARPESSAAHDHPGYWHVLHPGVLPQHSSLPSESCRRRSHPL